MTNLVYVIQKTEGKQPVSGRLTLFEALSEWKLRGYDHHEYKIVMRKGIPTSTPERPLDVMYIYVEEEDLQAMTENNHECLNEFKITSFLISGYHEPGS
jgi:hypothetical protein